MTAVLATVPLKNDPGVTFSSRRSISSLVLSAVGRSFLLPNTNSGMPTSDGLDSSSCSSVRACDAR